MYQAAEEGLDPKRKETINPVGLDGSENELDRKIWLEGHVEEILAYYG